MAGKQRMVCHLPKRVMRQYRYVQTVPRPPTTIMPLAPTVVVAAFLEFALHVIAQQHRGAQVPDDEPWKHLYRYIRWFYCVSHPIISNPPLEPEITVSRPVYQDILVDQDWGRHPSDPRQVISTMGDRVEHAMQIPEVVSNPLFLGILEGLRSDYIVFEQQPVPRRRSRSPQE